ncbi:aminotransferase class I/II-fold pyridoxal phosphate-dependent enzyme [Microbacterium sp. cx-55]|uniref:MalY/PatB family protein n=1 Tax=Microbacterium sp. cx-55 TaxID=2875948 RepID=UPI001CC19935|nr:aminotransferase class I/II-fold pyridoxal phosphate-dependent enzyme [Microbacterium sp. cx-55]MBZ4487809.1 aminotransferase class I/II-fold pyridoxal phosphate-dependent enzyme [Microbacterium sp. cx-55]UGB34779.1 aminotransferase class I/II-fold pyridoxal phosphate-dependent enzyme [Microbacterium sp. cx-55]
MVHPFDERTRRMLDRPESRKWSLYPGTIGAWVAEMDFGTAPEVTAALHRAIDEENLGYLSPTVAARLGQATSEWLAHDQGWAVDPEWVHPVADVMAALGAAVEHYSPAGSAVIVPTPAYMPFLTYLPSIGHPVVEVPGLVNAGRWQHDLDAIDAAFAAGARTLVLCNPHNPTGTVLERAELLAICEIVERHGGRVFADEIHAPIRYGGAVHVPYASISEAAAGHTITGTSASKAWNIPGMKAAQLITSNAADAERYRRFGFAVVHGAATLGVVASTAAYRDGRRWLAETNAYLDGNRQALARLFADALPGARYAPPEATYLAWVDVSALGLDDSPAAFFRERAGVVLTDGALCGRGYEGYVRMVLAMPRPILDQAVHAMADAVTARR